MSAVFSQPALYMYVLYMYYVVQAAINSYMYMYVLGDPTSAPATIAPVMISSTTES